MKLLQQLAKALLLTIIALCLLLLAVLFQDVNPRQESESPAYLFPDTLSTDYDLDSLKALIGNNKGLPQGFELAGAIAFTAYPELKEVEIDMVLTGSGAPMESTPVISSLFNPFEDRKYQVLLNNAPETFFNPILLRSLPFDAQVGILAHELGHIVYYEKLNLLEFGKWGLEYLRNDEFRAEHERTTDLMPVYHGLGSQIYQYAYYVRYDSSCTDFYALEKGFMDKYYLTDIEILDAMN